MIEIYWDNDEKTIIHCKFAEGWGLQDLHKMMEEVSDLIDLVEHWVYVIMDMSGAGNVPAGILSNSRSLSMKFHPRVKMYIDVTDSMFVEMIANIFEKVITVDANVQVVKTLEEAYAQIESDIAESAH